MENYPFSMRLQESDKLWLEEQSELLKIPVTHAIRKLFEIHRTNGIPLRTFSLLGEKLVGDMWDGQFTGLVRVSIVHSTTPVKTVEIELHDKTLSEFKALLLSMLE